MTRNKTRIFTLTASVQCSTETSRQWNKARKRNQILKDKKERYETTSICSKCDDLCTKSQRKYKETKSPSFRTNNWVQEGCVVQWLSSVHLLAVPWTAAHQSWLPFTNSWSLFKLMSFVLTTPSNHLILCRPLLLLFVIPSVFAGTHCLFPMCQLF